MQRRYIAPTIMLAAGAITIILNIINKLELLASLKRLLLVLIIFYIIGKIAEKIISKIADKQRKVEEDKEKAATATDGQEAENQLAENQVAENEAGITED